MTCKSPVGDISAVTLIRTDTTLDHSKKAEKVCSATGGDQSTKQTNKKALNNWAASCECANCPAGVELIPEPFSCKANPLSAYYSMNNILEHADDDDDDDDDVAADDDDDDTA